MRSGSSSSLLKSTSTRMFISSKSCRDMKPDGLSFAPYGTTESGQGGGLKRSHPSWCYHECTGVCPVKVLRTSPESFGMYTFSSSRLTLSNGIGSSSGSVSDGNNTLLIWWRSPQAFAQSCGEVTCGVSCCCSNAGSCNPIGIMHGLVIKISGYFSMSSSLT